MTRSRGVASRALLMLLLVVMVVGCGSQPAQKTEQKAEAPKKEKGGKLVMGLASDIMQRGAMDPALSDAVPNMVVTMNIFNNLVYRDTDGKNKPGLAESWTVSPDTKVYTFKLRKGVKFHDGTPFNAEAVKFTFDRIMDPALKSPRRADMGPFDKVVVKDELTVEVQFKDPFAAFINNLTNYGFGIVSPAAVQKYGKDFPTNPVGTGPFKFKSWVAGQSVALVPNPDYNWAPPNMFNHNGPPYLDELVFRFIPEEVPRMGSLETGECNAVVYLSADGLARFKAKPDRYVNTIALVPGMSFCYFLNVERAPTNELAVRQAINYSIDQKAMIDTLYKGVVIHAKGILSPASDGHNKEIDAYYAYDPAKAKDILDKAGWKLGSDGIRVKNSKKLTMSFATLDSQRYQMSAEWIQAALREVGIDCKIAMMDSGARIEAGNKGTHNAAMKGTSGNDPDILRVNFYSKEIGGDNYSRFKDPEVDKWLEDASKTSDSAKRAELYLKIQKRIMDQALTIPIWYTTHAFSQLSEVKDLRMDGSGYYPFLYDTYIKK